MGVRDIIKKGYVIQIYKKDGFRYRGEVILNGENFICILDFKINNKIFINWDSIKNIEILEET